MVGGHAADLALDKLFLSIGLPGLVLIGIVVAFISVFGESESDFIKAKQNNKDIQCTGVLSTKTFKASEYIVKDGSIIIPRKFFPDAKYFIADCDVK